MFNCKWGARGYVYNILSNTSVSLACLPAPLTSVLRRSLASEQCTQHAQNHDMPCMQRTPYLSPYPHFSPKQLQSLLQSVLLPAETGLVNFRGDQHREQLLRQLRYKVWEQVFKYAVQAWLKLQLQHPSWVHAAKTDLGPGACICISSVFPLRCSYLLAMLDSFSLSCICMNYLHMCGLYCCPALKKFGFTTSGLKECVFAFY